MVAKGAKAGRAKERKFEERKDRSIHAVLKDKNRLKGLEKAQMEKLVQGLHDGIERAYFPRQSVPSFFFILCKSKEEKANVETFLKTYKGEELGRVYVKKPHRVETNAKDDEDAGRKKKLDQLKLVLEAIPPQMDTEDIRKEFPECEKVLRFNARRCYVHFSDVKESCKALNKVSTDGLLGFKVKARFEKER